MSTTLEFFDYIFDRYAYLGTPADATDDLIASEIRLRRAAIHPDKLLRVSPGLLAAAEAERALIDQCALMLSDPGMRALYDEKLLGFQEKEPHLVSPDGIPRIDPSRFKIDLDGLLGDETKNVEAVEAQARALSGIDQRRIDKARKRAHAQPDDLDARDDLRDELAKKLVFLSAIEDFYWQAAGVRGGPETRDATLAHDGTHFTERLGERMEFVRSMAGALAERRDEMVRLGFAPLLLLAGPEGSVQGSDGHGLPPAVLAARAVASFDERSGPLREAVAQKALVIDEMASLCRWARLNDKRSTPFLDILMLRSPAELDDQWPGPDFVPLGLIVRIERATGDATPISQSPTPAEAADWPHELVALEPHPEMPGLFIEAIALARTLMG